VKRVKGRIDRPFFDKFVEEKGRIETEKEYVGSIVEEVGNILCSRIRVPIELALSSTKVPFSYGIIAIESLNISQEDLDIFRRRCELLIVKNEPRLTKVNIVDIKTIESTIKITMECVCFFRGMELFFQSCNNLLRT
jgi:predicted component of type VI protein secretion system